jgi:adenosylcobinamide-GDP ribazoletransferase
MTSPGGWRVAAAFLTRLPVGATVDAPETLARAVPWFPVIGAAVGLVVAGCYAASSAVLPPMVAAAVAVGLGVVVTGAFHEDGLADLADSLGGWSRDDALRIMKDPTHGSYGVLALVFSVVVRVAAVAALDAGQAVAALPAAHALGRAGAVTLLTVPAARRLGLGTAWASGVTPATVATAMVVGAAVATLAIGAWVVPTAVVVGVGVVAVAAIARRVLGGVSGDVMGAAEQAGEIVALVLAAALASAAVVGFPWWR